MPTDQLDDEGYPARDRRHWHVEKTISLSHIISTIAAVCTGAVLLSKFDTRLSLVERSVEMQRASDQRQDTDSVEFRKEMREVVMKINEKLDRIIERRERGQQ